ncbi:MAG: flavodoxin domain-containing protein [Anaerolineales bacterium]
MKIKVLLAYASTPGSTQEVAEALESYRAVVLGAPLYMFHLHKDALRFLSRHQKALSSGLPVAIFAGGPIETGDEKEFQEVRNQLDQELAKFPWLEPVAVEVIGGRFDPGRLRFPWNLIPALKQMPPSDLRDWEAIRAWADSLAAQLHPVMSQ